MDNKDKTIDELLLAEKETNPENYNSIMELVENKKKEYVGRGGKRDNAGRKPKASNVLEFQVRVSREEKEFLKYARAHNFNYKDLMEG